jgi:hypothetical protein
MDFEEFFLGGLDFKELTTYGVKLVVNGFPNNFCEMRLDD